MPILKYINSLPVAFTTKHYHAFDQSVALFKDNKLDSVESWDVLRTQHPHFSISEDRGEWLKAAENNVKKDGQDGGLVKRAQDIVALIYSGGFTHLFSAGVGGAGLEYQIKKSMPELFLTCSEYSAFNIDLLKKVFLEVDKLIVFDLNKSDWSIALENVSPDKQLTLLYRIDAQITDAEWLNIFKKTHTQDIKNILFIPTSYLTLRSLFQRVGRRVLWISTGRSYAFSGYLRTKKKFRSFWENEYDETELMFGGLPGFLLTRKEI